MLLTLIGRSLPDFRTPCQFFFSFFLFFDFRNIAFVGLSPGDSIWIGLSAGFGETCLPPGLGRRLGVLCNARYNQVEPTRYVGLQEVRLDGIYRRSFRIPYAWANKSEVFRSVPKCYGSYLGFEIS